MKKQIFVALLATGVGLGAVAQDAMARPGFAGRGQTHLFRPQMPTLARPKQMDASNVQSTAASSPQPATDLSTLQPPVPVAGALQTTFSDSIEATMVDYIQNKLTNSLSTQPSPTPYY